MFYGFRERMARTAPSHRRLQKPVQRPWVQASFLIGILFATTAIAVAAPQHIQFIRVAQDFLWAGSGVLALLGLTGAVVAGLIATDRLVLRAEHRLLFQTLHRSVAIAALGFLFAHVTLQIAFGQAGLANVVAPFGVDISVAFGVIASDLLIVIIVTGVLRRRFAAGSRPELWRLLHATAYLCWPFAIVHGLTAGRQPSAWVILAYALCLMAVGLALVVRMAVIIRTGSPGRSAERERPERATERAGDEQRVRERDREPAAGVRRSRAGERRVTAPQPKVPDDILDLDGTAEGAGLQSDLEFWSSMRGGRS